MRLAVIPARGGSKRIPRKNVRDFCGKPMLAWSISAALESRCFDRVILTTDDPEIAEVARAHGAQTPFMRPATLSDDHTPTVPVIAHAIDEMIARGDDLTEVCCIYATAPFVEPGDLQRGLQIMRDTGAMFSMAATSFPFPIQRAMRILPSGRCEMFHPEHALTRSQDLEEAYHDAGQFYWGSVAGWRSGKPLIGPDSAPVLLPRHRVQDIDTPEDWERAVALFKAANRGA
tara:strand:+ start:485 stop:1177 length:693 start_codon:yes stop_codon:yes gene_type:complete